MHRYLHMLSATATRVRDLRHVRAATLDETLEREDATTRAEELEHIAVYARAGYFNMGYTVDAFQPPH
jgi:hypothetical protein